MVPTLILLCALHYQLKWRHFKHAHVVVIFYAVGLNHCVHKLSTNLHNVMHATYIPYASGNNTVC